MYCCLLLVHKMTIWWIDKLTDNDLFIICMLQEQICLRSVCSYNLIHTHSIIPLTAENIHAIMIYFRQMKSVSVYRYSDLFVTG